MLEGYAPAPVSLPVYRLSNAERRVEALTALGADPDDIQEMLDFLSEGSQPEESDLIDSVFELSPSYFSWRPGRFGDGTYPVYYSALEWETAEAELAHHVPKRFGVSLTANIFYDRLECLLDGMAFDLRPASDHFPFLIDEPWPPCQSLGREARELGGEALLTQSVRRLEGTNAPVFKRDALNNPRLAGSTIFQCVNGAVTKVVVTPS